MSITHVVGVDPGLVHTGVVRFLFDPDRKQFSVRHTAVVGPDAAAVAFWIAVDKFVPPTTFIEGYRPRSHFNSDQRMVEAVASMKAAVPGAKVLDNMGVKKIVLPELMELLGAWKFSTVTHHQDLRSAARIALLGMLKDDTMNRLLADVVRAHLDGKPWLRP